VSEIVARQVEVGLDIVNDGEMSKTGFFGYVAQRLAGYELVEMQAVGEDDWMPEGRDFPEWAADFGPKLAAANSNVALVATREISYARTDLLEADVANLAAARDAHGAGEVFMTAASPGALTHLTATTHYASHGDYLAALAEVMKTEYDAIHRAGFVLQLDAPDLASQARTGYPSPGATFEVWRKTAIANVEALNEATRDIPPEAMRVHVCWGNYAGPHHLDVPLRDIIDILLRARPAGLSIEASNPRHEHEWTVFEDVQLPDGKVLIPGVVDSTSNFVEHPEVVAQRLLNFARVVGRENVVAGTDCGFVTIASWHAVDARVAFAKLASLVEGAALASSRLRR
jgi:5-methyltetrahydropteroyltriglutamate--homocysteine methyltransferase